MSVNIGTVRTFESVEPSKEQALKPLEEAAEVYGAWQEWDRYCKTHAFGGGKPVHDLKATMKMSIVNEIADCITSCCNLAASLGVDDLTPYMEECERRNEERGRYGVLASDGKPLEVGQTVFGIGRSQHAFDVLDVESHDGGAGGRFTVRCFDNDDGEECFCDPKMLTHERPDSWERIENDMADCMSQQQCGPISPEAAVEHACSFVRRCMALAEKDSSNRTEAAE